MKTRDIPKALSKTIVDGASEDSLKHWWKGEVIVAPGSLIWDTVDVTYGMGRVLWVFDQSSTFGDCSLELLY